MNTFWLLVCWLIVDWLSAKFEEADWPTKGNYNPPYNPEIHKRPKPPMGSGMSHEKIPI